MAVKYNGRYSADDGATWVPWFSGTPAVSRAVPAVAGALRLQGQAYDDSDASPPTDWEEITLTVRPASTANAASVVVAEIEYQVNGGTWTPYPNASRLAATRLRGVVPAGVQNGATLRLRGRWRDLSDGSEPTEWTIGPSYTVQRAAPAPVTTLAALPTMRGLDAEERARLASRRRITHYRDEVEDEDGVWRSLGDLEAEDFRHTVRVVDSPTDPIVRADLELWREIEQQDGQVLSLAPTMETSALNVRTSNGTYAPFIQKGRRFRRLGAVMDPGENPAAGDWLGVFLGYLDDPQWGADALKVTARDPASRLQDRPIHETRTYGAPVEEGGVWLGDVMRQILADNGFASETLCVVGALDNHRTTFEVPRGQSVWQALETLATSIGWTLRYEWTSRTTLQLCLYEPKRVDLGGVTPIFTLTPNRYLGVNDFRTDSDGVRGRVIVHFRNRATGEMDSATAEDPATLATPGFEESTSELVFENSEIDTPEEAQVAADRALADVHRPLLWVQIEVLENIGLRRGDVVSLAPNLVHHDTPQKLVVYELAHSTPRHERRTVVTLVGRHTGALAQWLAREAPPSPALGPVAISAVAREIGRDAAGVLVKITGEVTRGGVPSADVADVAILAVGGGVEILDGPIAGARAPSGTVWRLSLPESGWILYRAELPGAPSAFDEDRDPISRTVRPRLRWTRLRTIPHPTNPALARVDGLLEDPEGAATGDATVQLTRSGVDPTITPATITGPLPLTITADAPRQPFESAESVVEAHGTAPGVDDEWERVTIQAVEQDTQTPSFQLTEYAVHADRAEYLPLWKHPRTGANDVPDAYDIVEGDEFDAPPTPPAEAGKAGVPWTVFRGAEPRPFKVLAHKAGFASVVGGAVVPALPVVVPPGVDTILPTVRIGRDYVAVPGSGRLTLALNDPQGRAGTPEASRRVSDGSYEAYTPMTNVGGVFVRDVALAEGQTSAIRWRVPFTGAGGAAQELADVAEFKLADVPAITGLQVGAVGRFSNTSTPTTTGGATISVNAAARSVRVAASTTSMPTEADVLASGTVVEVPLNARTVRPTFGTVSYGQTLYVAAIPYTGSGGTGSRGVLANASWPVGEFESSTVPRARADSQTAYLNVLANFTAGLQVNGVAVPGIYVGDDYGNGDPNTLGPGGAPLPGAKGTLYGQR